jgi:predicted ATPase
MLSLATGSRSPRPGGPFELALRQPGLLRPLRAVELSDGTLR